MTDYDPLAHLRGLYEDCDTVIRLAFKGRPVGIDPALVRPGMVYVLDWKAEDPARHDGITVERVDDVETSDGPPVVRTGRGQGGAYMLRSTFAALVVAGPFDPAREREGKE